MPEQPAQLIDPILRRRALMRARGGSFLLDRMEADVRDRIGDVARPFNHGLWMTPWGQSPRDMGALGCGPAGGEVIAEPDLLPFAPASFDLVISLQLLHWVNDLPGALIQARQALRPDGLFVAALLGGDTLVELGGSILEAESEICGGAARRMLPMLDVRQAGGLLQRAGFAMPVTDVDRLEATYESPFALVRDLRTIGEANYLGDRRPLRRAVLMRAAELYQRRFSLPSGRVTATFEIVYLTGWAPGENQPKPLRPGSGKVSLADVLKPPQG